MRHIGNKGRDTYIVELQREEIAQMADAFDLMHDDAVQENRAEDALIYDQLAAQAYRLLQEPR